MENSSEIVKAIAERYDCSFYRVAKLMNVPTSRISSIKNGNEPLSKPLADKAAELLGLEPAYVRLITDRDRVDAGEIRDSYTRLIKRLESSAAATLTSVVCILCKISDATRARLFAPAFDRHSLAIAALGFA